MTSRKATTRSGTSLADLCKPRHQVEKIVRKNPKQVREEAMAKVKAKQRAGKDGGASAPAGTPGSPRVRTTVTKTTSKPDGATQTTTVEKVTTGGAAPRFNRREVMHPMDAYRLAKKPIPRKPDKPQPKIKAKVIYPENVRNLWWDWHRYNEFQEELKCWKQNREYLTADQKEERRWANWFRKEEEMHEKRWKAGMTDIVPFHLRKSPKEKKPPGLCTAKMVELPKSEKGKRRYMKRDPLGYYIRYNSVDDAHPEDLYTCAKGACAPEYVEPPLNPDGTFKKPEQMDDFERSLMYRYRKWEEFYFRVQAWENDKKWKGDPRIEELWRMKPEELLGNGEGGDICDANTAEGRAAARAADRARRAQVRSTGKTKAAQELERAMKRRGGQRLTGAAKVALQSLARKEAAEAAAAEAKFQARQARQRAFLKRGSKAPQVSAAGKLDFSRVTSRIGGLIKEQRAAAAAAAARAAGGEPDDPCEPMPAECQPPGEPSVEIIRSPGFVPPPCPPLETYHAYENRLRRRADIRQRFRDIDDTKNTIAQHMIATGVKGNILKTRAAIVRDMDAPWQPRQTISVAPKGQRPPPLECSEDSQIFLYDPNRSVSENFGIPVSPREEGDVVQGCSPMPEDWEASDAPMLTPLSKKAWRRRGMHPSPPKSIRYGRLPHHPMHGKLRDYEQIKACEAFAEQELEDPQERAYLDRCMEHYINKPLVEWRQQAEARVDPNMLHPALFRSNLRRRVMDTRRIRQQSTGLRALAERPDLDLPAVDRRRVQRFDTIPSPPCSPPPDVADLLGLDEPPATTCVVSTPPLPPLPYSPEPAPEPCSPPRVRVSPFHLPARYIPEMNNPYLQVAQRAIETMPVRCPSRAQEIAETYERVQRAAQGLTAPMLMEEVIDDFDGIYDLDDLQCEEEPFSASGVVDWELEPHPAYHQFEGPQAGALYHEHLRRPQLGPWHYPPPGGQRGYHNWDAGCGDEAVLVDIPQDIPAQSAGGFCI